MNPEDRVWPAANALDFTTGDMVPHGRAVIRRLSEMRRAFADPETVAALLSEGDDRVIYRSYVAEVPEQPGHLAYLTEVYLGMSGHGLMLMQARDGQFRSEALTKGTTVYVPPGWAHRTVNTGPQELVFLAVYFSDAGHDYRSIEAKGFAARVMVGPKGPQIVGN